LHIIDYMRSLA